MCEGMTTDVGFEDAYRWRSWSRVKFRCSLRV